MFLTELAGAANAASAAVSYQTVQWDDAPGLVSQGLPWGHMGAKDRLAAIQMSVAELPDADEAYPNDEIERKIAAAYSSLRGTIERAIREVFLNNTVQPFSDVVSVDSFGVIFGHQESDWIKVDEIYARACEATEAHDTPGERHLPLPSIKVLLGDIQVLRTTIDAADQRRKAYEKVRSDKTRARKKLLA